MQVADVLDDQGDQGWVDALGWLVADTDWSDACAAEPMHCALLALPPHPLHRVMSACLGALSLTSFLTAAPADLHAAAVSAALRDGVLHIPDSYATAILPQLQWASFPAPGLQRVCLHGNSASMFPASSGGLLARGLAAHPSLTSIAYSAAMHGSALTPRWLHSFAACLRPGALPHLVDLELTVAAHPGGCAALAACLRLLPTLTSLRAVFKISRPQSTAAVPLSAYGRFAGAPASLPRLQSLAVTEDSKPDGVSDAGQPLTCLHSFLSLLSAPELQKLRLDWCPCGASASAVLKLITRARFPGLRELRILTAVDAEDAANMMPGGDGVLTGLPPLTDLDLDGPCPVSGLAIATSVCSAVTASLTSLTVGARSHDHDKHPVKCDAMAVRHAWEPFWAQVGRCTELELAALEVHDPFWWTAAPGAQASKVVAAALRPLSKLRSLSLHAASPPSCRAEQCVMLSGSILGSALATLTRLRSLAISHRGCRIEFDSVQPLLGACMHLQHVSQLGLCFPGVTVPLLAALVSELPALEGVTFDKEVLESGGPGGGLGALQARFPSVVFKRCGSSQL